MGLADVIRVKGRGRIVWMGLAMMVSTRLWLAGVVSPSRDTLESQNHCWTGAGLLTGLAAVVHWQRDQAQRQQACDRGDTTHGARECETCGSFAAPFTRRRLCCKNAGSNTMDVKFSSPLGLRSLIQTTQQ
jgi:hypothetical protein